MNPEQEKRGGWTSASSAAADDMCEARHLAQRGLPEEVRPDSQFGRAIHEALFKDDPTGLDEGQLSIYEQCSEIRTRMIEKFFGADAPNVRITKERRLWCSVLAKIGDKSPKPERYQHSGQVDLVARLGRRALIVEYKALPGDVAESPTNKQLRDQAVLTAGELVVSEVGTVVVQPLVTHDPEICLYTDESLKKAEQEMFARVRRSNNPNAKRTPSTVGCKFCLARHTCAEYQKWVTAMAPKSEVVAATPVDQWTPEMRTHFISMRPAVQQWLDDCYSRLKALMKENATSVPGYKLEEGNTVKTVNNPQELFGRFVIIGKEWAETHAPDMHADATLMPVFMKCVKVVNKELSSAVRMVTGLKGQKLDAQVKKLMEGIVDEKVNDQSIGKDS